LNHSRANQWFEPVFPEQGEGSEDKDGRQTGKIETLISEEALLFAMFLRNERQSWKPRIAEFAE